VTLSNCINSGIYKIMVLPQYKGQSMMDHIEAGWNIFSYDLGHYLRIVPPQMRIAETWYQGTADSVRQNAYLVDRDPKAQTGADLERRPCLQDGLFPVPRTYHDKTVPM
jgi:glucose-1-phosphate adenylyltransferase